MTVILCATVAAVLVCGSSRVVSALPPPAEPDRGKAGSGATGSAGQPRGYRDVAREWWLAPVGVVVCGLVAAGLGLAVEPARLLWVVVPLVPFGYVLAVLDARLQLLPRLLVLGATFAALAALLLEAALTGELEPLFRAVGGMLLARTVLWLVWLRGGVGFGDVRLAALVGLVTACLGWSTLAVGLTVAVLLAVAWVLLRAVETRLLDLHSEISLGPFLLIGAWIGLLVPPDLTWIGAL